MILKNIFKALSRSSKKEKKKKYIFCLNFIFDDRKEIIIENL